MPVLCSLFPRQRSTLTWASGPGRFRQGGRVQIDRLEMVPLRNWVGNRTTSCCCSSRADRECGRDGVSAHCSSDPGEEQRWPGWTDARSRSLAPPGYSPAAPYSGPSWYCLGLLQRSWASYSTGVCRIFSSQSVVFPVVMYGCESWIKKKVEHWRTDAFKLWYCEDSQESLGMQRDQTSQS